jgi:hypothetical protein
MNTAIDLTTQLTPEEALLEDLRMLIMGGILVSEDFDQDDLPIAARIAAANDCVGADLESRIHVGQSHSYTKAHN